MFNAPTTALTTIRDAKYLLIRAHGESGNRLRRTLNHAVADIKKAEKAVLQLQLREYSDDLQVVLNNLWVARCDAGCASAFGDGSDLFLIETLSKASGCAGTAEKHFQRWIENNA